MDPHFVQHCRKLIRQSLLFDDHIIAIEYWVVSDRGQIGHEEVVVRHCKVRQLQHTKQL